MLHSERGTKASSAALSRVHNPSRAHDALRAEEVWVASKRCSRHVISSFLPQPRLTDGIKNKTEPHMKEEDTRRHHVRYTFHQANISKNYKGKRRKL